MENKELRTEKGNVQKEDASHKEPFNVKHIKTIKAIFGLPPKYIEKNRDYLEKNGII